MFFLAFEPFTRRLFYLHILKIRNTSAFFLALLFLTFFFPRFFSLECEGNWICDEKKKTYVIAQ